MIVVVIRKVSTESLNWKKRCIHSAHEIIINPPNLRTLSLNWKENHTVNKSHVLFLDQFCPVQFYICLRESVAGYYVFFGGVKFHYIAANQHILNVLYSMKVNLPPSTIPLLIWPACMFVFLQLIISGQLSCSSADDVECSARRGWGGGGVRPPS